MKNPTIVTSSILLGAAALPGVGILLTSAGVPGYTALCVAGVGVLSAVAAVNGCAYKLLEEAEWVGRQAHAHLQESIERNCKVHQLKTEIEKLKTDLARVGEGGVPVEVAKEIRQLRDGREALGQVILKQRKELEQLKLVQDSLAIQLTGAPLRDTTPPKATPAEVDAFLTAP